MSFRTKVINRIIFLVFFLGVAYLKISKEFSGLPEGKGAEQAVIAREFARGNGLTTNMTTPVTIIHMAKANYQGNYFQNTPNVTYAPLYPATLGVVFKVFGVDKYEREWTAEDTEIFTPDLIVVIYNLILMLGALAVFHHTIQKMFSGTIAGISVLLLTISSYIWEVSFLGASDMLVFFLFSISILFFTKAVENEEKSYLWGGLSIFFSLMTVLTDWIAIWVFVAHMVCILFLKRPRIILQLAGWGTFFALIAIQIVINLKTTSSLLGISFIDFLATDENKDFLMGDRNASLSLRVIQNILSNYLSSFNNSLTSFASTQAGFFLAPCFLLCCFNNYVKLGLNQIKWSLLTFSVFLIIGMGSVTPNPDEIHSGLILFIIAPLTIAFTVAFIVSQVSKISRSKETAERMVAGVLLVIGSIPFANNTTQTIRTLDKEFVLPETYAMLQELAGQKVVSTDTPALTAWYADVKTMLIPNSTDSLKLFSQVAKAQGTPISGIYLTERSFTKRHIASEFGRYNQLGILTTYSLNLKIDKSLLPKYGAMLDQFGLDSPTQIVTFNRMYFPYRYE